MAAQKKKKKSPTKSSDYIDNATMYLEIVKYNKILDKELEQYSKTHLKEVEELKVKYPDNDFALRCAILKKGQINPPIPESLGKCFLMLSTRIASRYNFSSYTFNDELISDGIMECVLRLKSFNINLTNNPFAYFTTVIWACFLRKIKLEKKHVYIKIQSLRDYKENVNDNYKLDLSSNLSFYDQYSDEFIESFEKENGIVHKKK